MKLKTFILSLGAAGGLFIATANAAESGAGGDIHFKGELVNAACAVSTDSADQIVQLGQYRTANFAQAGDTSTNIGFTIVLHDCDPEIARVASVAFSGQQDGNNPELLALSDGENASSAQGVGIEILDRISDTLTPDGSDASAEQVLQPGTNTLHFSARYKSTVDVVQPGQANGEATFVMLYP